MKDETKRVFRIEAGGCVTSTLELKPGDGLLFEVRHDQTPAKLVEFANDARKALPPDVWGLFAHEGVLQDLTVLSDAWLEKLRDEVIAMLEKRAAAKAAGVEVPRGEP